MRTLRALLLVGFLCYAAIQAQAPPAAAPASTPLTAFSAARAAVVLRTLARAPHPTGSGEAAAVRRVVVARLRQLGLEVSVHYAAAFRMGRSGDYRAASVCNIAARLHGLDGRPSGAILLCAHTDTVPHSPGASDDGAAVAALLETARALTASPPLRRDVIFLFTDGEELGLLGARAFVKHHPWARDVGMVLNFEARGSRGASYMFETSLENGGLISLFLRAVPYAASSSLMVSLYRALPNDTDFRVFRAAGLHGLNFAYVDGLQHYHSVNDSLANLDLRSLQHQGSYALSLARALGNEAGLPGQAPDRTYFNIFGRWLASYPSSLAGPLSVLAAVLLGAAIMDGLRRERLQTRLILRGAACSLLALVAAPLVVQAAWMVIRAVRPGTTWSTQVVIYGAGFSLLAAAITLFLLTPPFRCGATGRSGAAGGHAVSGALEPAAPGSLAAGALAPWAALALLTGFWLPGASYLFTWPVLFAAGSLAARLQLGPDRRFDNLIRWAGAAPGLLLMAPTIRALLSLLSLLLPALLMTPVVFLTALLLPVLAPERELPAADGAPGTMPGRTAAVVLLTAGGAALLFGLTRPLYQDGSQIRDTMIYAVDADRRAAFWMTTDGHLDEWTRRFIPIPSPENTLARYFPFQLLVPLRLRGRCLTFPAPEASFEPPGATVEREEIRTGSRTVWLRLKSRRHARTLIFFLHPEAAVIRAELCGMPLPRPERAAPVFTVVYTGAPPAGVLLKLTLASLHPARALLVDTSDGLPGFPGEPARPSRLIPTTWSDQTAVITALTL